MKRTRKTTLMSCTFLLAAGLIPHVPFSAWSLLPEAHACSPRDLHSNPTPADLVVVGRVTEAQFQEQHEEEPVWVTQAFMRLDVESCIPLEGASCLSPGEHTIRHDGRHQFLVGERVALVLFRRPDSGEPQIIYRFTLSDQDGDGEDEVYHWRRGDLLADPAPMAANHYWADNLQWNFAPGEAPPPDITWEDVLFNAFRDAPPRALAVEGLPVLIHNSLSGLLEWVTQRNLELRR